ncbi:MAG: PepSY domain-containing protein [Blastomonas sp.]
MEKAVTFWARALMGVGIAGALALGIPASNADAQMRRGEQNDARQQLMAGQVKSLREIEARILPRMRGMKYLGPEFDPDNKVYRLKFLKNNRVVFVDVDARSGAILRESD